MDLVVPDQTKTLHEGAIAPWNPISSQYYPNLLEQACQAFGVDMDTPFKDLSKRLKISFCTVPATRNFIFIMKTTLAESETSTLYLKA